MDKIRVFFVFLNLIYYGHGQFDVKLDKLDTSVSASHYLPSQQFPDVNITNNHDPKSYLNNFSTEAETVFPVNKHIPPSMEAEGKLGKLITGQDKPLEFDYGMSYDPLTSRYAPKESDLQQYRGDPYKLTPERLKQIRDDFMYWYFDMGGNDGKGDYQTNIQTSTPQIHKNFNFQLPFFGFRYNYTRVSMHGYLEFSDPPENYRYPLVFPVKDWPKKNDPAFIGIFYSKCRIGAVKPDDIDQRRPGVYFRMERDLPTRIDQFGVEVRERVKWDIRTGVIGSETFEPKHVVIVTWKNMSFAGGIDNSLYKTNTFQMVLATDEVFTYAIFNYLNLQWSAHTEAGGDTTGGEGGVPAYIGFNAGNGTQSFEYKPYSQASVLRDLTGRGFGNGKKGRHIFRIDEKIMLGTCNKDTSGANLPLVFAPESGTMLGGTVVNITGPCFKRSDKVTCKFDNDEVIGVVVDYNRAVCIQPQIFAEGYIRLEVSINGGKYDWKGKYFIETPATATERIFFEKSRDIFHDVHQAYPSTIKISWNPRNLTTRPEAGIQISLWGYRETTIKPELLFIDMIEDGYGNTGSYTIMPSSYRNRYNNFTRDMEFGFLQINLTNPEVYDDLVVNPVIWSRPIPLGWYFAPQWERKYGKKWPEELCNRWLMHDRYLKNFAHELPQCPCKLEQALFDKGRFLPDFDCDKDSNSRCLYNKGAMHCVRTGSPSMEGSGQQCCYDKYKYLMLTYDQQWGSRPARSHNLGYIPWIEANKVPTLSHWFHDVAPFYSCCVWQEEQAVGCETFRFERRPTQDCVAYQPPGVATAFGDPHIITFDNLQYTFNGKGEFVLVRANTPKLKFDVQARFEQAPPNYLGDVPATLITSIAARGNNSAIIEVRLRPKEAQWRYRLDVLADGRRVYFDRPSLKVQHFLGVTVYTPTYILNQSEVIMMFDSGAGVEVVENQGFMSTRVYLPWTFINQTTGLFGNWSFNAFDDLVYPDGSPYSIGVNIDNFKDIHENFAMNWTLEDKEDKLKGGAMFKRDFGKTATSYSDRTFIPEYESKPELIIPPNRTFDINRAYELCDDVYQCRYDYAVSLDRDMAHFTKNYYNTYTEIRRSCDEPVISCGILETPRFGRKSNFLFTPGTKVTFECNQDFILIGDKRRTCMPNGRWNIPEYGYTECLRHVEYDSIQLGITAGYIMAVMVPLVFILALVGYWVMRSRKSGGSENTWQFERPRSRSQSRLRLNEIDSGSSSPLKSELDSGLSYPSTASTSKEGTSKKRRSYDGVYHTNEPLPGKPDYEFEEKPWDLSSPSSSTGSPPPTSTPDGKTADTDAKHPPKFRYDSDSDYATVDDPSGRPNETNTLQRDELGYGSDDYARVSTKVPTPFKSAEDLLKIKQQAERSPLPTTPTSPTSIASFPDRPLSSYSSRVTAV